jgi:hypothetical protein
VKCKQSHSHTQAYKLILIVVSRLLCFEPVLFTFRKKIVLPIFLFQRTNRFTGQITQLAFPLTYHCNFTLSQLASKISNHLNIIMKYEFLITKKVNRKSECNIKNLSTLRYEIMVIRILCYLLWLNRF